MQGIERKFLNNLNERDLRRTGRNNNLISDMHLAYVTVGYDCPFVGEMLKDSDLRRRYEVNVASIQRGNQLIPVPGASTRLFPGDVLAVVGSDNAIQDLLPVIEKQKHEGQESEPNIEDMKFTSIQLGDKSELIGKSVAQSGIRDRYQALLVAVQRNGEYTTSDFNSPFEAGDTLWLVGNPELLEALR